MTNLRIMDCTLRDGANIIGSGFSAELTKMMIEGLIRSNIKVIEMGNAFGLGAYEANNSIAPLTDIEYLELIQPYLSQAEIGMFIGVNNVNKENLELAVKYNIKFLRIGANAGDSKKGCEAVKLVKQYGIKCCYAIMKGYVLSADELAEEAKLLEDCGLDEVTIMDSAGTMMPDQVEEYISRMVTKVQIPVGFHGHNNLGLSSANAIVAAKAGATVFDSGLLGMARSAGNCATEVTVAVFQRQKQMEYVDFQVLLEFIDKELAPAMSKHGYKAAISPIDLVLGFAGCHSSFTKLFETIAKEKDVPLYELIIKVSQIDRKAPSEELINKVADEMKYSLN